MASVLSIQAGRVAPLGPNQVPSAFIKHTISGTAFAQTLGIEGDQQADLSVHGGPDKAIYCYPFEHYKLWANDAPRHAPLFVPGGFGENITTMGLDEQGVAIGDVLQIGAARMQITQPRQPCFKLALRFADSTLGKIMMASGRTGWYVRVLEPGELKAGDEILIVHRPTPDWTITRFNEFIVGRKPTVPDLEELSKLEGLPMDWREWARKTMFEGPD